MDLNQRETQLSRRTVRVKNKNPAPVQITAEQIIREARELQKAESRRPPIRQIIANADELEDYRIRKRTEFENQIRRSPSNKGAWVKYAKWEESHKQFARARSIWERALEAVDYRDHTLWLKYADFEMKNKFVNHARNVWDRATELLPRVDQLWYKYIHMEEMLGNVNGARRIFERWMEWSPDRECCVSYVELELRYNEIERAREVSERFLDPIMEISASGEVVGELPKKRRNAGSLLAAYSWKKQRIANL